MTVVERNFATQVLGAGIARRLGWDREGATPVERTSRDQRPVQRPFRTARWPWVRILLVTPAVGIGITALATRVGAWLVLGWCAAFLLGVQVLLARRALRPADPGVQMYEDLNLPSRPALPAGVRSSQLFVPCGLALGWFVRRGLVSDWFRDQSGDDLAAFESGQLTGPQLYALWQGILASDMLDDEGKAFARRYLWGYEPYGAIPRDRRIVVRRVPKLWPRARDQWFLRDLEAMCGDGSSVYAIDDDAEAAAAFGRLADERLARWRRWRLAYAYVESERGSYHQMLTIDFEYPPVACSWQLGHETWREMTI